MTRTPRSARPFAVLIAALVANRLGWVPAWGSSVRKPPRAPLQEPADWPMPRHDPLASAVTQRGPQPPLRTRWQRKIPVHSQLLAVGGRVLFLSSGSALALDGKTGETAWKTRLPEVAEDRAPPLGDPPFGWSRAQQLRAPIAAGGRIFFAVDTTLYALDTRTGAMLWQRAMWERWPPPEELDDSVPARRRRTPQSYEYSNGGFLTQWKGRLLVGTGRDRGRVVALDPATGRTAWQTPPLEPRIPAATQMPLGLAAPIVSSRGTLYFRTEWDGRKQRGGQAAWEVDAGSGRNLRRSRHRPVAAGPGYLVEQEDQVSGPQVNRTIPLHLTGSRQQQAVRVRCVDTATGRTRWRRSLVRIPRGKLLQDIPEDATYAAGPRLLVIAPLVAVYDENPNPNDPPGAERRIYAVDPASGRLRWRAELTGVQPSPANVVQAGGVVYALDYFEYGGLTALDGRTGRRLWEGRVADGPHFAFTLGPAISGDTLYAADYDQIWALESQ